MRLSARLPLYFCLWLVAEFAAFALVAKSVGVLGAVALCCATSFAGLALLRQVGFSAAFGLRRAMDRSRGEPAATRAAMIDGALLGVGALLLILPGFVSDFFGLALAAPSVRNWIGEKMGFGRASRGAGGGPTLVELDPQEWTRLDQSQVEAPTALRKPRRRKSEI